MWPFKNFEMETSVKKFLCPTLYPKDRNPNKLWFIKYRIIDYTTGTFKSKKYYGSLNLIEAIPAREEKALEYIRIMNCGGTLPNYQGMKRLKPEGHEHKIANIITCCFKYLIHRKHELDKRTISQYRSRINHFGQWLNNKELQNIAIGALSKDHARAFLIYLKDEKHLSNKTYNEYKSLLCAVWNEFKNDGRIQYNPWSNIDGLPENPKHFESYPAWLRTYIKQTLPDYDAQLWLFIQFVYYCAIRPHCELRHVKIGDINWQNQRITIRKEIAKGPIGKKKARIVNIYNGLFKQLIDLKYNQLPSHFYLFSKIGVPGEELTTINHFINKWNYYKKTFNIPSEYKIYGSKHTGGKRLSLAFNEFVTKEHFGHHSLDSTRQYTEGIDKDELNILKSNYPEF